MSTAYACLSALIGVAVLWLAFANGQLAAEYTRSREWGSFWRRIIIVALEAVIGAAGLIAAVFFATGALSPI